MITSVRLFILTSSASADVELLGYMCLDEAAALLRVLAPGSLDLDMVSMAQREDGAWEYTRMTYTRRPTSATIARCRTRLERAARRAMNPLALAPRPATGPDGRWVVKFDGTYWEGPYHTDVTTRRRHACVFTRLSSARAVAKVLGGKVFRLKGEGGRHG